MKALKTCSSYLAFIIAFWAPSAIAGWTPPVRISDVESSYSPRVVANGDTLHVVYWRGGAFTSSYYLRSENGGHVWSEPLLLPDTTVTFNNVVPIIRLEDNKIAIIWRGNIRGGNDLNYGLRLSMNGGQDWNNTEYVLADDQESLQKHAFFVSSSVLYLIYSRIDQGEIAVHFTKSTNWGGSWTEPTEVFRTQETGLFDMVDRGDTIHFMWNGRFNYDDRWEMYYIKSEDAGDTWLDNVALSTLDDKGSLWPSISINDEGELVACWMDFKYSSYFFTGDIFVRYSYDAGDTWTEEDHLTSHHLASTTRILWQGDSIHVVWEDWRNDQTDIYYMMSTDNGLTWEVEERVEDDPGQSLNPSLAAVDETVHVVWRQDSGLDGRGIYYSRRDGILAIPTLSEWGMLIMALLLMAVSTLAVLKRKRKIPRLEGGEANIYYIVGLKLRALQAKEGKTNDTGQVIWDALEALGNKISLGIYFARARNDKNSVTIKMLYIK